MMYEEHFGLAQNPFQPVAEGEAIFEGPAQTKVIADLKIALTARDSIAVVTGPVGVGKTTIVTRALEEMGPERLVARLGRTQVGSDELVDLLLAQCGVVREPTRRFECLKTFNRILSERAASGARTFIVIEDAERLGADLLEELEALTATDGGASAGANIILMGPQNLDKLIAAPALERMRQRIRLQQVLERFTAEQVELYLRHRITAVGGNFDAIFEEGTALMVRRCSGGIPRVIDGLCETALTVAAEKQLTQVTPRAVFKVAVEIFGMQPGKAPPATVAKPKKAAKSKAAEAKTPKMPAAKPPAKASTEPAGPVQNMPVAPEAKPKPQQTATPAAPKPATKSTTSPKPSPPAADAPSPLELEPEPKPKPEATIPDLPDRGVQHNATAAAEVKPAAHKPMPALPPKFKFADDIVVDKDTQTNLQLQSEPRQVTQPELPSLQLEDSIPRIANEAPGPPSAAANDIPTLGESSRVEKLGPTAEKPVPDSAKAAPAADSVPAAIAVPSPPAKRSEPVVDEPTASFAKIDHDMLDAALASLAVHDEKDPSAPSSETPGDGDKPKDAILEVTLDKNIAAGKPAAKIETDPAVLEQLAAEMEKAESLEDVSDKLAETLFGCDELEVISLKIRENAPPTSPDAQEPAAAGVAAPSPAPTPKVPAVPAQPGSPSAPEPPAAAKPAAPQPKVPAAPAQPGSPSTPEPPAAAKPAAPQKPVAAVQKSVEPAAEKPVSPKGAPQPETIENQFSDSMTKTLRALSDHGRPPSNDEDTKEIRAGLLGRLRESFKR